MLEYLRHSETDWLQRRKVSPPLFFEGHGFVFETDLLSNSGETTLLRIGATENTGNGLFAKCFISAGMRIFGVQGECYRFTREEQRRLLPHAMFNFSGDPDKFFPHAIAIDFRDGNVILMNPYDSNPFRYLNHSCHPNAARLLTTSIMAIRDISPGEQITADYSLFETDPDWSMPCQCRKKTCRGTIGPVQTLPPETIRVILA